MTLRVERIVEFREMHRVGVALRLGRESRGMTQAELAEEASIARSRISRIENALVRAQEDELRRMGGALNLPVRFFFAFCPYELERTRSAFHWCSL